MNRWEETGHNIPLHSKKSITVRMARIILEQYLAARKYGLSVIHSKRWAIYAGESVRFGRGIPYTNIYSDGKGYSNVPLFKSKRREKSVWYNGTSKHAKTETFDRLMKDVLGTTRFTGMPKTVNGWMQTALRRHNKELWADLTQAAKNYKNIVGTLPTRTEIRFLNMHRKWLKIRRGRDLFVRDFGKFDITIAVKQAKEYAEKIGRNEWVFFPVDITAAGYGMEQWRFQNILRIPVVRTYYLRHRSFWKNNNNRLDEISSRPAIERITQNPDIAPAALLRYLQEVWQQEVWQGERNRYVDNSPEPFAHLVNAPSVNTPFGVLRPVMSPKELTEIGKTMNNCASGYVRSIKEKSTLLLAIFDESGKPIALGEVHYDRVSKRWVWGQRLGPNNEDLERNLYEVFQNYPLAASGVWEYHQDLIED